MGDPRLVCFGAGSPSRWQPPACCPVQNPVLRLRAKLSPGRVFWASSSWGTAQHRDVGRCARCAACPPWAEGGREPRRARRPELWGPVSTPGSQVGGSRQRPRVQVLLGTPSCCALQTALSPGGALDLGCAGSLSAAPAPHAAGEPRAPRLHTRGWGGVAPVSFSRMGRWALVSTGSQLGPAVGRAPPRGTHDRAVAGGGGRPLSSSWCQGRAGPTAGQ